MNNWKCMTRRGFGYQYIPKLHIVKCRYVKEGNIGIDCSFTSICTVLTFLGSVLISEIHDNEWTAKFGVVISPWGPTVFLPQCMVSLSRELKVWGLSSFSCVYESWCSPQGTVALRCTSLHWLKHCMLLEHMHAYMHTHRNMFTDSWHKYVMPIWLSSKNILMISSSTAKDFPQAFLHVVLWQCQKYKNSMGNSWQYWSVMLWRSIE